VLIRSIYKSLTQYLFKSHWFYNKKILILYYLVIMKTSLKDLLLWLQLQNMSYQFRIISNDDLHQIIPLVYELNDAEVSEELLKLRFNEMKQQNYECAGVYDKDDLIGVSGLWFCTRHYVGKSVELDHVYIIPEHRSNGIGKQFMAWIENYVKEKGCNSIELNTYVQNYPSHKFYYNEGFEILGYHFLKSI